MLSQCLETILKNVIKNETNIDSYVNNTDIDIDNISIESWL
jgi:hypothetical protein